MGAGKALATQLLSTPHSWELISGPLVRLCPVTMSPVPLLHFIKRQEESLSGLSEVMIYSTLLAVLMKKMSIALYIIEPNA